MITLFCIRPKGFNVGNDAIYIGMQHFLYNAFGQVINLISLPSTARYESQVKAGLTAKTIHEINQYGHGVIVGGGNIYENGALDINLDALETLEVPMMLFSLSWGRIYNRYNQLVRRTDAMPPRTIKALHQKASYSLARDNTTDEYLKSLGCSNSRTGGCPTIYLDKISTRLPKLHEKDEGLALISIRNPSLMNIPLVKQSQVPSDIRKIIEFLKKEKFKDIRMLCHDYRDIPFAASFRDIEYIYTGDVFYYLSLIRSCAINISYRLHATLPAISFGTPTIKISYDERAISLMETIGLGNWNINMIHSDNVIDLITNCYHRLNEFKIIREEAKNKWDYFYDIMANTFNNFAIDVKKYHNQI